MIAHLKLIADFSRKSTFGCFNNSQRNLLASEAMLLNKLVSKKADECSSGVQSNLLYVNYKEVKRIHNLVYKNLKYSIFKADNRVSFSFSLKTLCMLYCYVKNII